MTVNRWDFVFIFIFGLPSRFLGFPSGSDGKESTCDAGRPGFDPWVGKIPLEEGVATHSSILAWGIPMVRGTWWAMVHGLQRVRHD